MAKEAAKETLVEVEDDDSIKEPLDTSQTVKTYEQMDEEAEKESKAGKKEATKASEEFDKKVDTKSEDEEIPSDEDKKGDEEDAAKKAGEEDDTTGEKTDDDDYVLSDDVITRAIRLGMEFPEVQKFPSNELLTKVCDDLESARASVRAAESKLAEKTGEKKETPEEEEFKPFELKFENEDEIDESITKAVKSMNEHYAGQVKKLQDKIKTMGDAQKMADVETYESTLDTLFTSVGKEFKEFVGEGPIRNLGRGSQQVRYRNQVVAAMNTIDESYYSSHGERLPMDELFNRGVETVFGDKSKEITKKNVAKTLKERGGQTLHKPAGKGNKPLTGVEAAVQTSKEFDKKIDELES